MLIFFRSTTNYSNIEPDDQYSINLNETPGEPSPNGSSVRSRILLKSRNRDSFPELTETLNKTKESATPRNNRLDVKRQSAPQITSSFPMIDQRNSK